MFSQGLQTIESIEELNLLILSFLTPDELSIFSLIDKKQSNYFYNDKLWKILFKIYFPHIKVDDVFLVEKVLHNCYYKKRFFIFMDSQYPSLNKLQKILFSHAKQGSTQLPAIINQIERENKLADYLSATDLNEYNPLMWAMAKNNNIASALLREKGAHINATHRSLLFAAKNNHLDVIKEILNEKPELALEARTRYGNTAFHCASMRGYLPIVKYFVENLEFFCFSIDEKSIGAIGGYSPLSLAIKFNQSNIVEYFLTQKHHKLSQEQIEKDITGVLYNFDTEILEVFLKHCRLSFKAQNDVFTLAVSSGHIEHIKILLDKGNVDIHVPSTTRNWTFGYTPLEIAISCDKKECIELLIKASKEIKKETIIQAYYNARACYLRPNDRLNFIESILHLNMQNPVDGKIDLSGIDIYGYFDNISKYFIPVLNGHYFLRDKSVHTIDFSNINFGLDKNNISFFSNSPRRPLILKFCEFIADNPAIKTIILRNSNIDDSAAEPICKALEKNTHLTEIILNDNPGLSGEMENKINEAVSRKMMNGFSKC